MYLIVFKLCNHLFFFKQKTAYEMRISDWSSDVCSSDLRKTVIKILNEALATEIVCVLRYKYHYFKASGINATAVATEFAEHATEEQIGRASCRERVCKDV